MTGSSMRTWFKEDLDAKTYARLRAAFEKIQSASKRGKPRQDGAACWGCPFSFHYPADSVLYSPEGVRAV
jgi:hypothetical protein